MEVEEDETGLMMDKIIQTPDMVEAAGPEMPCRRILRPAGADTAGEKKVEGGVAEECALVDTEVEGGGTHLIYQREPVLSSTNMVAANTATIADLSMSRTRMETERGIREEEKDYRTRIRWEFLYCKVNFRECKDSAPVLFIVFFATLK
jgi:hypothetical protein